MKRTLFFALGFFFSFMLGSAFTMAYLKYDNYASTHTEKVKSLDGKKSTPAVVIPSKVAISTLNVENVAKESILLKEVIVQGVKGKYLTEANNISYLKPRTLVTFNSNVQRNPIITTNLLKGEIILNFITPVDDIDCIEPKARSPGINMSLRTSVNRLNYPVMLRSEKKALKQILKLLFANKHYFRIKNSGDIVVKEHWYSQKMIRTSWNEIFNYTIPRTMSGLSKDLAEDFYIKLTENKEYLYDELKLVKFVRSQFIEFCIETGFQGKAAIEDLEPAYWKNFLRKKKILLGEKVESLKQLNIKTVLSKHITAKEEKTYMKTVNALPSRKILSLKQIMGDQMQKYSVKGIGLCISGIPEIDASWPKVFRLVEREAFV